MSRDFYLIAAVVIVLVAVGLVGWVMLLRTYASSDGERRRRTRMQGPFVPLSAEDIAEDEERIRKRRSGPAHGEP